MALLSPGVEIKEKDYSNIVPTVASGIGGVVANFAKGPIEKPMMISSEAELVKVFGTPTEANYNEWFAANQFLLYTNRLWCVRAAPAGVLNATCGTTGVAVLNDDDYEDMSNGDRTTAKEWVAKDPGLFGNNIGVIMVDNATWDEFGTWCTTNIAQFPNGISLRDYFRDQPATSAHIEARRLTTENKKDELHIMVVDVDGHITGTRYAVLEMWEGLSKASDAMDYRGQSLYYANVIARESQYIRWSAHTADVTSGAGILPFGSLTETVVEAGDVFASISVIAAPNFSYEVLAGGVAGTAPTDGDYTDAYDKLANTELYDVNLLITGALSAAVCAHVIENVAYKRKDAVAFLSPHNSGAPYRDSDADPLGSISTYKQTTVNVAETYSSYGFMDTGFKYIYDKFNSKYRWVPLNGDMAGLCAQTDSIADPWWSPGGFNRGGVRNVIKLAYNPDNAERDVLYPKGVNPVVAFPGQGVVLFGDRTMTLKPSAFDRINVRRLFNVLEKAIAIAAKYQLFEFNDSYTRAQFKNMVEPYLRNIQGRRGIYDFFVQCDESNNTGEVIDRNEFVASIYIKPSRSINFITLNFIATRTDVSFSQVIGA
jgi:hypothetical protein